MTKHQAGVLKHQYVMKLQKWCFETPLLSYWWFETPFWCFETPLCNETPKMVFRNTKWFLETPAVSDETPLRHFGVSRQWRCSLPTAENQSRPWIMSRDQIDWLFGPEFFIRSFLLCLTAVKKEFNSRVSNVRLALVIFNSHDYRFKMILRHYNNDV